MELCYYHRDTPYLKQDDISVVFAEGIKRDDGTSTYFGGGLWPERLAQEKAKEYPLIWSQDIFGHVYEHEWLFEYIGAGSNPTETLNGLIRKMGFDHQIKELPRDYWLAKIKDFLGTVTSITSIQEVHLIGGLARGKEASKDADLLLVVNGCESMCPLAGIDTDLDLFCFSEEELQQLKSDNFKITENMQLLYRR